MPKISPLMLLEVRVPRKHCLPNPSLFSFKSAPSRNRFASVPQTVPKPKTKKPEKNSFSKVNHAYFTGVFFAEKLTISTFRVTNAF